MAFTQKSVKVNAKLEDGTDDDGNMKYVSVSLAPMKGTLDLSASETITSIMTLVAKLAPCLNKTVGLVEGTTTGTISS